MKRVATTWSESCIYRAINRVMQLNRRSNISSIENWPFLDHSKYDKIITLPNKYSNIQYLQHRVHVIVPRDCLSWISHMLPNSKKFKAMNNPIYDSLEKKLIISFTSGNKSKWFEKIESAVNFGGSIVILDLVE